MAAMTQVYAAMADVSDLSVPQMIRIATFYFSGHA
jgi:hypothetical protein